MMIAGVGLIIAVLLIFLRIPVAIALAVVGIGGLTALLSFQLALTTAAMAFRDTALTYSLSMIPLFILMGNVVGRTGMATELYDAARALMARFRGGLALATIIAAGGFSAISGSSVATAATLARVAVPEMQRRGYSDALSAPAVAAGATLGVLIPPSVILVIYGIITETHIGQLFIAGVLPGILGIAIYCVAVMFVARMRPDAAPRGEKVPFKEVIRALSKVWSIILLFMIVMGGIYGGIFTPTEAAGVGAAASLVIAGFRRALTFSVLREVLYSTASTTTTIFAILIGASIFGEFLNFSGAHHGLLSLIRDSGYSAMTVVIIILAIYIVMGCFLESLSMMLLTMPLFFPVVQALGVDPVWFGILVVVTIEIGLITPPVGMNLFVLRSVVPSVTLVSLFRGIIPFVMSDIVRLALLVLFPSIALILPEVVFR